MSQPIAYLRDVDGTGSLHACAASDPGAFPVYADPVTAELRRVIIDTVQDAKRRRLFRV